MRNARTHVWQVQVVAEVGEASTYHDGSSNNPRRLQISSYAVAGNSLLLGAATGVISLVDLEKFPLRLKDSTRLAS